MKKDQENKGVNATISSWMLISSTFGSFIERIGFLAPSLVSMRHVPLVLIDKLANVSLGVT
jgi:hypothetical protein